MVLGTIYSKPNQENASYTKQRRCFPLELDKSGPHTKSDHLFQELKAQAVEIIKPTTQWNYWISKETWLMVDIRAPLRRDNQPHSTESRKLPR
jgi:hypothetical protein